MKKLALLLAIIAATPVFAQTSTPNIGLKVPATGSNNWYIPLNYNFTLLDQLLSGNASIPALKVTNNLTIGGSVTAGSFIGPSGSTFATATAANQYSPVYYCGSGSSSAFCGVAPFTGIAKYSISGLPVAAAYTDILGLWTGCTGTKVLAANGTCITPAGTPAGTTYDLQINSADAFAADTGKLFYNLSTHTLGSPNILSAIVNGMASTDQYNTSNNGISTYMATCPSGKCWAFVPATSTDTEVIPTLPQHSYLQDMRGYSNEIYSLNPQQGGNGNKPCNVVDFVGLQPTQCIYTRQDLAVQSAGALLRVYQSDGPGYTIGNGSSGSASLWSLDAPNAIDFFFLHRGIKQAHSEYVYSHGTGDTGGSYRYLRGDGGATAPSDEGEKGEYVSALENPTYFHGSCAAGCTTGSANLTTTNTSGQNNFTDGGYALDITKGTLTGAYSSTATVMGYTVVNMTGITMTPSTAWGTFNTATDANANGKFQVPVSETINVTLGTSPTSPGSFTVANNACLVNKVSGGFFEQVPITAVGTTSGGIQSVTFSTRYGWASGTLLMQGAMCGQMATLSGATWRTATPVVGAFSATQALIAGCTGNGCNDMNILSAMGLITGGNTIAFYPGAEVIGTNSGTLNSVQLGTNTVAWATSDVLENPHPAAQYRTGAHFVVGQTTPINATYGLTGLEVEYNGNVRADQVNNTQLIDMTTNQPIFTAMQSTTSGSGSYANFAVIAGVVSGGVDFLDHGADVTHYIYQYGGGAFAGIQYLSGGNGFNFLANGGYAPAYAENIPPVPTATGQIPIAVHVAGTLQDYSPIALSGDATMTSGGVVTVSKVNNGAIPISAPFVGTDASGRFTTTSTGVLVASLTTTAAASDTVTLAGMTASGHCSAPGPTNSSAATNIATTYISAKAAGSITVAHTATAGMTYDVVCTTY